MAGDFRLIWADIGTRLRARTDIKSWSAAKDYTGGSFRVDNVNGDGIIVSGANIEKARMITREDFKKIYEVWDDYKNSKIPRSKLTPISQNTTYILSILRWRETTKA